MGPATLPVGEGIDVRPHPHIGLATVTYLFEGAMLHRDSTGAVPSLTVARHEVFGPVLAVLVVDDLDVDAEPAPGVGEVLKAQQAARVAFDGLVQGRWATMCGPWCAGRTGCPARTVL